MGEQRGYQPLDSTGRRALADALGDTPLTVISAHLLRRGACRAYVAGSPDRFRAAVIQDDNMPGEPLAIGSDVDLIWKLLQSVDGWACIELDSDLAGPMGKIMQAHTGRPVRYHGDMYHALTQPAVVSPHSAVRRLILDDLPLFESAPAELCVNGFGGVARLLEEGFAAGAVVDGRLVAVAHTYAISPRHADIGVFTLDDFRGRGLCTAAAGIVAECVQASGRTPVWSTGEDNRASLRVARKVGFREVARRMYVIPVDAQRRT